jgi:hypothetical protein
MARQRSRTRRSAEWTIPELKRAVKALEPYPLPDLGDRAALHDDYAALRDSTAARLEPLIRDTPDLERARAVLADHNRKQRQIFKRSITGPKQPVSEDPYAAETARKQKLLDLVADIGVPFTPTRFTLKPFLIWHHRFGGGAGFLVDSHIDPVGYSWARVNGKFDTSKDATVSLYYYWVNQSTYPAGVNVSAKSIFNGHIGATAEASVIDGGKAHGYLAIFLLCREWWNQPPTYPPPGNEFLAYVWPGALADASGFWTTGDQASMWLHGEQRTVRYDAFLIPPGATAVFELQLVFRSDITRPEGAVGFDFSTKPHYSAAAVCQLELLTAPRI